jgi:hypothetical protein
MDNNKIYDCLKCPLTNLYFHDPVLAEDGVIYERMAITHCVHEKFGSKTTLVPVKLVKSIVDTIGNKLEDNKFLNKKPYFLFKKELIADLENEEYNNLLKYTEIVLTDYFDVSNKVTIGFELLSACKSNDIIKHVINNSIDFDMFGPNNLKLIHNVSCVSNQVIFKFLVENKNVVINEKDSRGNYPLHNVAKFFDKIDLIYDMFTDENLLMTDNYGLTVAHYLAKYVDLNYSEEKFNLVNRIMKNSNIRNVRSNRGLNCFHYVCQFASNPDTIKKLFDLKEIDNIEDITGGNENVHDLVYKNKNLSKDQKLDVMYSYLIIVNNRKQEYIENAIF